MKLIRFGEKGKERPGIWWEGQRRDCSAWFTDWNPDFFRQGGVDALKMLQDAFGHFPLVPEQERWASPVARPALIVCVGLNYADHAREAGLEPPKEPVFFLKPVNTLSGPFDPVTIPAGSQKTDWELELAFVVGKDVYALPDEQAAASAIVGYAMANDLSERHFQLERGGQWVKGKSSPGFCPFGPWLSIADPDMDATNLSMELSVNGDIRQKGTTADMIFKPAYLLWYLSQFMQLEAGDIVLTGTPAGVALGKTDAVFLQPGDALDASIDGLGCQWIRFR
jgi:2-keto-4-pentenoate hydratase/2-oxohepta-3-ene-1,7-dioic acid hydratase in catechol pathway